MTLAKTHSLSDVAETRTPAATRFAPMRNAVPAVILVLLSTFVSTAVAAKKIEQWYHTKCYANLNSQQMYIVHGQSSFDACKKLTTICTNNDPKAEAVFSSIFVRVNAEGPRCDERLPMSTSKSSPPAAPQRPEEPDVRTEETTNIAGTWGERNFVYTSKPRRSGKWQEKSEFYDLCSGGLPTGYSISSDAFELGGDRRCFRWADCIQTRKRADSVCYAYRMQGHGERHLGVVPVEPDEGVKKSWGVLAIVTRHQACLESSALKVHTTDSDHDKALVNNAPCFVHTGFTGAGPSKDALYRFRVPVKGTVFVRVSGLQQTMRLYLLNSNGGTLDSWHRDSAGTQHVTQAVTPGEYVVRVQPIGGPSQYTLNVSFTPD